MNQASLGVVIGLFLQNNAFADTTLLGGYFDDLKGQFHAYVSTKAAEGYDPVDSYNYHFEFYTNYEHGPMPVSTTVSNLQWGDLLFPILQYATGSATSSWFSASTYAREIGDIGYADASAASVMTFTATSDAVVPFGIHEMPALDYSYGGFASLVDVTADNKGIWYYHCEGLTYREGDPPPSLFEISEPAFDYDIRKRMPLHGNDYEVISFVEPTEVYAGHEYRLVLYTGCNANSDQERLSIWVTVPEPTTLNLAGIGLMAALGRRLHQRRVRST